MSKDATIDLIVFSLNEALCAIEAGKVKGMLDGGSLGFDDEASPQGALVARRASASTGEKLLCFDLRQWFRGVKHEEGCGVFLELNEPEKKIGLLVKEVKEIISLPRSQIKPLPAWLLSTLREKLITSVFLAEGEIVFLLDYSEFRSKCSLNQVCQKGNRTQINTEGTQMNADLNYKELTEKIIEESL